jgi:hypothetical protein
VRSQHPRIVGSVARDLLPQIVLDQADVDLALQDGAQDLTLRIVGNAGELNRTTMLLRAMPRPVWVQSTHTLPAKWSAFGTNATSRNVRFSAAIR